MYFDPLQMMDVTALDGLGISSGCVESPVMTWRSDLQGCREWSPQAWGAFTGRPCPQREGCDWTDWLHPEDRERCAAIFRACVASATAFTMDYRLLRMDGTYRWVMDCGLPQHEDQVLRGYTGTCVDVHARRLSGDRLAERMRMHRLQEHKRDAQLAALARELRGPLSPGADGAAPQELLVSARARLADAAARIESLVAGAGVESGASARLVPIADVMSVAMQHVDSPMTRSGHHLEIDMPEPGMLLHVDPSQLGRAVADVVEFVGDSCERPSKIGVTVRHGDNAAYLRIARCNESSEPDSVPLGWIMRIPLQH
jgi:hypothetical protein